MKVIKIEKALSNNIIRYWFNKKYSFEKNKSEVFFFKHIVPNKISGDDDLCNKFGPAYINFDMKIRTFFVNGNHLQEEFYWNK